LVTSCKGGLKGWNWPYPFWYPIHKLVSAAF
jgi:hypothetical protein